MYRPSLPCAPARTHEAVRQRAGRRSGHNLPGPNTGKPGRLVERRGGAAPYVTGGAPKGEATPLKTSSPTGVRAYVTGPRGRTLLAPGASSALHPARVWKERSGRDPEAQRHRRMIHADRRPEIRARDRAGLQEGYGQFGKVEIPQEAFIAALMVDV
jgi:hypothetical protein